MEWNPHLTSRRIAAHCLYTPHGFLRNGVLTIDPDGTITDIATSARVDSLAGVEFHNGILLPGLVNAHCHLELSHMRGAIASGGGFAVFAQGMREHRERFTHGQQQAAARYRDAKMWADGVSAVGDISNSDVSFPVKRASRIAYHTFLELYGLKTGSLDAIRDVMSAADDAGLSWSVTPHSTYSLNRRAFGAAVAGAAAAATADAFAPPPRQPLSIHFMECESEMELFRGRGKLWEWYREQGLTFDFPDYGSPAERILTEVPADRNLLLIHNTFVTEDVVAALQAKFGQRLTWVLCPRSNRYITGEQPPVGLLRRHGARIAVGTDSLASNADLSVIGELTMFSGIPLDEMLSWATSSGAESLGFSGRLGSLEVGKTPGVVLLEGIDWPTMTLLRSASTRRLI